MAESDATIPTVFIDNYKLAACVNNNMVYLKTRTCSICRNRKVPFIFRSAQKLKKHLHDAHGKCRVHMICIRCRASFETKQAFTKHECGHGSSTESGQLLSMPEDVNRKMEQLRKERKLAAKTKANLDHDEMGNETDVSKSEDDVALASLVHSVESDNNNGSPFSATDDYMQQAEAAQSLNLHAAVAVKKRTSSTIKRRSSIKGRQASSGARGESVSNAAALRSSGGGSIEKKRRTSKVAASPKNGGIPLNSTPKCDSPTVGSTAAISLGFSNGDSFGKSLSNELSLASTQATLLQPKIQSSIIKFFTPTPKQNSVNQNNGSTVNGLKKPATPKSAEANDKSCEMEAN